MAKHVEITPEQEAEYRRYAAQSGQVLCNSPEGHEALILERCPSCGGVI